MCQRLGASVTRMTFLAPCVLRKGRHVDFLNVVEFSAKKMSLQIMSETYEAMPAYRLCTSDGVLQLTEGLAGKLHQVLEERARAEGQ